MSQLNQNTTSLQEILEAVINLPEEGTSGIDLPELTNEGTANDLVDGKELIDAEGKIVVGTNPYEKDTTDTKINTTADLISQIKDALKGKASGGGESNPPVLQDKIITENGIYTADDGYDGLGTVMVNVPIPDGYVRPSGTLEVTENGTYDVTEKESVAVSVAPIGGLDVARAIVTREITEYSDNEITKIGTNAFNGCSKLTSVDLPAATTIGYYAFRGSPSLASVNLPAVTTIDSQAFQSCNSLASVDLPAATTIGSNAFDGCSKLASVNLPAATEQTAIGNYAFSNCNSLTSVYLPKATRISNYAFQNCNSLASVDLSAAMNISGNAFDGCSKLTSVDLPKVTGIYVYAFRNCTALTSITLRTTSAVCTLSSSNAFSGCTALTHIYVPSELVDSYKSATNWSAYADKIYAIEDE